MSGPAAPTEARPAFPFGRVLVTGGAGLLGRSLLRTVPAGVELHATERSTPVTGGAQAHGLDLADAWRVRALWQTVRPALVIHTAASQQVPERDIWLAARNVVDACCASGTALVHISTDAVLDGEHAPFPESAPPAPVHEYGRWKARAETYVRTALPSAAVVRTSLIVSASPLDRGSAWVADALRAQQPITLFVDELRCAIGAEDLARQVWEVGGLPAEERGGVWHLAGPEALSRYALGLLIAARCGLDPAGITPGTNRDAPEPRPRDLRLLTTRADQALRTQPRPVSELFGLGH